LCLTETTEFHEDEVLGCASRVYLKVLLLCTRWKAAVFILPYSKIHNTVYTPVLTILFLISSTLQESTINFPKMELRLSNALASCIMDSENQIDCWQGGKMTVIQTNSIQSPFGTLNPSSSSLILLLPR
jgi:hypothetical protein